ncbi:MAG TPA: alpha/beta hydrolase [Pseudolysinimonas sp.]|nr:alpha/beta hydrolase [Schumannella sp.]HEV7741135.1 alpha/beta hydrolase [Pseudolysinimonas sp.]
MATGTLATEFVTSSDGTRIAFSREGSGPVLVLVDGAMCYRAFGPSKPFTDELKGDFTVVSYDRRGRGESGDSSVYDATLEIDDLKAVLDAVGGSPYVLGFSSGAGLAYRAAAAGVAMKKLVGYESPWVGPRGGRDYVKDLDALNAAGRGDKMIDYFMVKMIGAPFFMPVMFRLMRSTWTKLKAVGSTIRYDARVMGGDFQVPVAELAAVKVPTLVAWGSKAAKEMVAGNEKVAASIPGSQTRVLEGQTHNVSPAALAPVLREFFA